MNRTRQIQLVILTIVLIFTFLVSIKIVTEFIPYSFTSELPYTTQPENLSPFTGQKPIILPDIFIILLTPPKDPLSVIVVTSYEKSPYLASILWIALLFALFYKGKTKSAWQKSGYDYEIFKVLVKMRGASTRIKIMQSVALPKNKHQLANELELDWRSIDAHVDMLLKYGLVEEMALVGTAKYYIITTKGSTILTLLKDEEKT